MLNHLYNLLPKHWYLYAIGLIIANYMLSIAVNLIAVGIDLSHNKKILRWIPEFVWVVLFIFGGILSIGILFGMIYPAVKHLDLIKYTHSTLVMTTGMFACIIFIITAYISYLPISELWYRYTNTRRLLEDEKIHLGKLFEDVIKSATEASGNKVKKIKVSLRIMSSDECNAYAYGNSTIIITTRMLATLSADELKGIMAHELGHIVNGDAVKQALYEGVTFFCWLYSALVNLFSQGICRIIDTIPLLALLLWPLWITLPLLSYLANRITSLTYVLVISINRKREYSADNFAVRIGYKTELLMALKKIDDSQYSNLFDTLKNTHPTYEFRAEAIQYNIGSHQVHVVA